MQTRIYRVGAPRNPLLQILALGIAAIVAVGAVFLGAILLALFFGLAVIAGLILYVRLWWLRRRAVKHGKAGAGRSGDIVEVEYTVVEERSMSDEKPRETED